MVVQSLPLSNSRHLWQSNLGHNAVTAQTNTFQADIGGVQILLTDGTGKDWSVFSLATASTTFSLDNIALPDEYADGNGRLIGLGFELNNTTAPLHKQGTAMVWRTPQQQDEDGTYFNYLDISVRDAAGTGTTTVHTYTPFSGRQCHWFPQNASHASLLSGTRIWEAEKGAYVVVPFISSNNPVKAPEFKQPLVVDSFGTANGMNDGSVHNQIVLAQPISTSDDGLSVVGVTKANRWTPQHSSGCALMGLSQESTITVTVNAYYEYFPNSSDTALVTLAKPSACYDPVALAMYSEALSSMPVGVEASMNGFGDWFAGVVSEFAPLVGTALTPVLGPLAAAGGALAGNVAKSYLGTPVPQSPQSAPRPQAPRQMPSQPKPSSRVQSQPGKRKAKKKKRVRNA